MEFLYDIRGFLRPYQIIQADLPTIKSNFVDSFEETSTRQQLYQGLLTYNQDLSNLLENPPYSQWLNGSFISTKINPRDIDLVTLLDHELIKQHESDLKPFLSQSSRPFYGIDAYIIRIYPEKHPLFSRTQSDLAYWAHWFSRTRRNRKKQTFSKGFIEIKY